MDRLQKLACLLLLLHCVTRQTLALFKYQNKEGVFINKEEASQFLSRHQLSDLQPISGRFGMRTDIGDGWEELVDKGSKNSKDASYKLETFARRPGLSQKQRNAFLTKSALGSLTGLIPLTLKG